MENLSGARNLNMRDFDLLNILLEISKLLTVSPRRASKLDDF